MIFGAKNLFLVEKTGILQPFVSLLDEFSFFML